MTAYQPVKKPLSVRVEELINSLLVVRDCLHALNRGARHSLIPLSGQLRALLYEKKRGNKPLLLDLADQLGHQMQVYSMPGVDEPTPPELRSAGLLLRMQGFPFSIQQEHPEQKPVSLADLLKREILEYKGKSYKVVDLIRFFANKAGGAHYSLDIERDYAELLSFNLGIQPLQNALRQVGDITLRHGALLLKKLSDIDVHFILIIPKQEIQQPAFVWDSRYGGTHMRVHCRLAPFDRLVFGMTSINGVGVEIGSKGIVDLTRPTHALLTLRLNEDLSTGLSLEANGESLNDIRVPHPLFIASDPTDYDTFVNRSHEDPNAGLRLGFVEIAMFGAGNTSYDRAKALLYFQAQTLNPEKKVIVFDKGSYGSIPRGTKDMQMTGSVHLHTVKSFVPPPPTPPAPSAPPA